MQSQDRFKILIADDEPSIVEILSEYARLWGYEPIVAENGQECIDILSKTHINALLLDMLMPVVGGFQVLEYVQNHCPYVPVIIVTGEVDVSNAVEATKMGAYYYVTKPMDFIKLEIILKNALSLQRLESKVKDLHVRIEKRNVHVAYKAFFLFTSLILIILGISYFMGNDETPKTKTNNLNVISDLDQIQQLGYNVNDVKIFCKLSNVSYADFLKSKNIRKRYEQFSTASQI